MGIYVGRSPSHASNVAIILNPRTGHVSPQFRVVFDDYFTMVPYLCTGTVPPHWADLVRSSATIQMYTEKQVGTWQSIPDLETEQGDFSGKPQILSTTNQDCEGVGDSTAQSNRREQHVSFVDQPSIDIEINNPTATSDSPNNQWHMPSPIHLETSGLHCLSRTEVLARRGLVYSNTTLTNQDEGMTKPQPAHLCSASQQSSHLKSVLVLFSTICSFGYGLSCMAHSLQEKVSTTSTSTFSNAIDSYHCVNQVSHRMRLSHTTKLLNRMIFVSLLMP